MTCDKGIVILARFKKRLGVLDLNTRLSCLFHSVADHIICKALLVFCGVDRGADCDGIETVLGEDRMIFVKLESFGKTLAQSETVVQRTAEKHYFSGNLTSLRQSDDRLIYHRLIYASRDVFLSRSLIEKRLYVSFCEYTAAGGNGIYPLMLQRKLVKLGDRDVEKGSHLIDKGAGAARTGAVHSFISAAREKNHFRVFSAELDYRACIGSEFFYGFGGCENLLNEGNIRYTGKSESRGTGYCGGERLTFQKIGSVAEQLESFLANLGKMTLITPIYYIAVLYYHKFCRCGTDVYSDSRLGKNYFFHL